MHVLVVEDDEKMAGLLKRGLEEENHRVTVSKDGGSGLEIAESYNFDVIVLDVMLPHIDGFEVARRLRRKHIKTPVLMLTARDAVPDITTGLDSGADDYLTKPFAFAELVARIRALARRPPEGLPTVLQVRDLSLDPATRQVKRGEREIKVTATEYRLLEVLMRNRGDLCHARRSWMRFGVLTKWWKKTRSTRSCLYCVARLAKPRSRS